MDDRAKELFNRLREEYGKPIRDLIGKSEDAHLDCKEWPTTDGDAQRMVAKAVCGFRNADGGVLVVGMKARSISKDEPDLIDSAAPVPDTRAVKSRILNLVGELVEPRVEGIQVEEVNESAGSTSGFVVMYIPGSDGPPSRSRKDWRFYQRIGSGTFPMEYFQIEEKFGKRPPPKLELYLEEVEIGGVPQTPLVPARWFVMGLRNVGRGIAKFPSIRFRQSSQFSLDFQGISGIGNFGLPSRSSEREWIVFRGGVDDVIFPQELRKIAKFYELGGRFDNDGLPYPTAIGPTGEALTSWVFKALTFQCEISGEGIPTMTLDKPFPEYSHPIRVSELPTGE